MAEAPPGGAVSSRRVSRAHHAGLVFRSKDYARTAALVEEYRRRFASDFLAIATAEDRPGQHL